MSSSPQPPSEQPRSLYRRHRPRSFTEVVGQEPVVRTLRNAVQRGKVHHAYLFVGSRGTGKTSMAKILAACLNCEQGPTVSPCGTCESCVSIGQARSLDVIEMDAASNNSVEDIRELRESVAFAPLSGRTKVYILDEAHMLSTAAWNAFLKTLEEPPPHTVFVLATTEAQKVPATVIDRCHRFDFQMPTVEQVSAVVMRAAEAESISIPPEAVAALARAAAGSFRDALGTLEQLLTYSGSQIALDDVLAVLGVADAQLIESTLDAIAAWRPRDCLLAVERCASAGRDPASFAAELQARARELLVVQVLEEVPEQLRLTPDHDERLAAQAARVPQPTVVRLLDELAACVEAVKAGADARTLLELALLKVARPEVDPSTRALLARIERLEAGAGLGGAAAPMPAAPESRPEASPSQRPEVSAPESRPESESMPDPEPQPDGPTLQPNGNGAVVVEDLESAQALWPAIVETVRSSHALLGAVIAEATPVALQEGELTLAFPASSSFKKKKAEDTANRAAVSEAIASLGGRPLRVRYELREEQEQDAESLAQQGPADEEEMLRRLIAEFDAQELPADEKGGD